MKLIIAAPANGMELKNALQARLAADPRISQLRDMSDPNAGYPQLSFAIAQAVAAGEAERAILICGTGIGMALAADKVPGIRAANIQTPQFARLFREHNDGNVLCLSGRFTTLELNEEIVRIFLTQQCAGGRHAVRVKKVMREDDPGFRGVEECVGQEG